MNKKFFIYFIFLLNYLLLFYYKNYLLFRNFNLFQYINFFIENRKYFFHSSINISSFKIISKLYTFHNNFSEDDIEYSNYSYFINSRSDIENFINNSTYSYTYSYPSYFPSSSSFPTLISLFSNKNNKNIDLLIDIKNVNENLFNQIYQSIQQFFSLKFCLLYILLNILHCLFILLQKICNNLINKYNNYIKIIRERDKRIEKKLNKKKYTKKIIKKFILFVILIFKNLFSIFSFSATIFTNSFLCMINIFHSFIILNGEEYYYILFYSLNKNSILISKIDESSNISKYKEKSKKMKNKLAKNGIYTENNNNNNLNEDNFKDEFYIYFLNQQEYDDNYQKDYDLISNSLTSTTASSLTTASILTSLTSSSISISNIIPQTPSSSSLFKNDTTSCKITPINLEDLKYFVPPKIDAIGKQYSTSSNVSTSSLTSMSSITSFEPTYCLSFDKNNNFSSKCSAFISTIHSIYYIGILIRSFVPNILSFSTLNYYFSNKELLINDNVVYLKYIFAYFLLFLLHFFSLSFSFKILFLFGIKFSIIKKFMEIKYNKIKKNKKNKKKKTKTN